LGRNIYLDNEVMAYMKRSFASGVFTAMTCFAFYSEHYLVAAFAAVLAIFCAVLTDVELGDEGADV
jgi:hypothetical protein